MLKRIWSRLRLRFLGNSHSEVDEELQFHLDQQVGANIAAGMSPKEASRKARIAFGAIERARESCREERPLFPFESMASDVRYALRGFRRNPIFTLTIIATLALGIGATTAVFSVVDRILFRSLPYAHGDRLVSLGLVQSLEKREFMLGAIYFDWRDRQQSFEAVSSEQAVPAECDLTEQRPMQLSCAGIEASFLPMLGVSPFLGRNFTAEEGRPNGPPVALLTFSLWRSRYNSDPSILHKLISIDGNATQVVGVMPANFELPSLHTADILLPMTFDEAAERHRLPGSPMRAFARLKPGVTVEQATAQIDPLFQSFRQLLPSQIRNDFHLRLRTLRDRQMDDVRPAAWVLFGTALSVLLIACINIASLLLARGAARTRDLALRSSLGASRVRLARQALIECVLFSIAGSVAGCILAEGLLRIFLSLAPANIPYLSEARLDLRITACAILASLVCGLVFGIVPACQKPSGDLLSARAKQPRSSAVLRQSLAIAQIAISIPLLASAMLLLRSFHNLQQQQLGMRADNTLTVALSLGEQKYGTNQQAFQFFQQLQSRLGYGPGVFLVAVADSLPPGSGHNQMRFSSIGISGNPPVSQENGGNVTYRWVSPEYFRALDIPIVQGACFTEEQLNSSDHYVILSKALAARLFPKSNPIGERLQLDQAAPGKVGGMVSKKSQGISTYLVVGVAADVKNGGLSGEDLPEYYRLRRNRADDWQRSGAYGGSAIAIVRTATPASELAPWIRSQVTSLDPALPVDIATMKQRVSKLADGPRFQTMLVGFFASSGLVLLVIGLYGIIAFLVLHRTHEIGVRMALGADRVSILQLVLNSTLRITFFGIGLGGLLCVFTTHLLRSLLFNISPHDPLTLAIVPLLLIFVALVATFIPARHAIQIDPSVALRND